MPDALAALPAKTTRALRPARRNYARSYWLFILPAGIIVAAVIAVPLGVHLFMSVQDLHVGGKMSFAGLANYRRMLTDERFLWAIVRTFYFTALAVVLPTILGVAAAVCFNSSSRCAALRERSSSCR